jgi:hypothetical protein
VLGGVSLGIYTAVSNNDDDDNNNNNTFFDI